MPSILTKWCRILLKKTVPASGSPDLVPKIQDIHIYCRRLLVFKVIALLFGSRGENVGLHLSFTFGYFQFLMLTLPCSHG